MLVLSRAEDSVELLPQALQLIKRYFPFDATNCANTINLMKKTKDEGTGPEGDVATENRPVPILG